MWMVVLGVIASFVAYWVGLVIEISPGVNLPGLGIVFALLTMGGLILAQIKRK